MSLILGILDSGGAAAGAAGSYESIATVIVSTAVANVDFTSIPSTYTHLQIRGIARASSLSELRIQFNGDTASNYSWHGLSGNGTTARSDNGTSSPRISAAYYNGLPSTASIFGAFVIDILDYANTNKYKTTRALVGYDANGSGGPSLDSGNWRNTNAITSIKLFLDSTYTFQQYSQIALYGIKGS
jgi:hypothetical protein